MFIIIAIIAFGILIAVHEFGHFATAKLLGVRVNEFSIGMGPAIFTRQRGETQYSLRLLPLGGFCAMEGEDELTDDPRAFTRKPAISRVIILVAGSFMNFLLGVLVVFFVLWPSDGFVTSTIDDFFEGCPYEGSDGLMVGDTIKKIDGHRILLNSDFSTYLSRGTGEYDIVLERDGQLITLEDYPLLPVEYEVDGETVVKYGLYFEVQEATLGLKLDYTWRSSVNFVRLVIMGLSDLVQGAVGLDDLSGPVGIVSLINDVGQESESASDAAANIAYLCAFIAINLAVMNMLPIPALDGGRVFFLIVTTVIEKITRRQIDPKYEGYIHAGGLVLLLGLMAFVMLNDIIKLVR